MLYIPRGCYHIAVPMNEPALHLTLGLKNPRTMDLALWMVERLRASGVADCDVPSLAGAAQRLRYSEEIRGALLERLDPDLVEQFVSETGAAFKPRPSFSLPWSATPGRLPPGRDFLLKLNVHARFSCLRRQTSSWPTFTACFQRISAASSRSWMRAIGSSAPLAT